MKYKDLIQFEPIEEVIKFNQLKNEDYRHSLVRNFVFSNTYEKTIIPEICRDLDYTSSTETFGLQIVGDFGTGKSHLMSLVSLVAEDATLLPEVNNESARKVLGNIAGKYKVIRFELGTDEELWRVVCYQIDQALAAWGVDYSISNDNKPDMYADKLRRMMAQFEAKFPDKGLMLVIDEMLSYLKSRANGVSLNRDLSVLQALGQTSDKSRFRMMFGVQELIYNSPEFQYAADMLNKVNDRYKDITITKQDVQFVVQQRLLKKTDAQRDIIRRHLSKFTEFFTDMHAKLEDYVSLFPVNPSFFENFQQIRISKSQREVLKTLTVKFQAIFDKDIPETEPGLICYDQYWDDLQAPEMQTDADVRRVTAIMQTVHQKITENFTGARANKAVLAHRIANACAVKILQDTLEHTNGVTAENLIDGLCYLNPTILDREMLGEVINTTASQIVSATVGQYFEKNAQNQEYHLRIEGGVNYEQKIKDYVLTMAPDALDSYFFSYLVENLPIEVEKYRREFPIYPHSVEWKSHKVSLDGYIFMGNPDERSTTQPEQYFYIYFMPIFNKEKIQVGTESDSVYIRMDKVSDEMRQLISLYAASEALIKSVDTSQKRFYEQYRKTYEDKLRPVFQRDFIQCTEVYYQGEQQTVNLTGAAGMAKEHIISEIASNILEEYFCQHLPNYPKFSLLRLPITSSNRSAMIAGAKKRIANPSQANRDSEAILAALGLFADGTLSVEASQYAQSVKQKLEDKGEGQVLNRDEILYQYYEQTWRTRDFEIEADLEFLVLCTMVSLGDIEISLPGNKSINAANIADITTLPEDMAYNFSHVRRPKGMNLPLVREIFVKIEGHDLTRQLDKEDTFTKLLVAAQKKAGHAVTLAQKVRGGIFLENEEVVSPFDGSSHANRLQALASFCDKLQNYGTKAKMSNLPWTLEQLGHVFDAIPLMNQLDNMLQVVDELRTRISYLVQAKQYMTDQQMEADVNAALERVKEVPSMVNDDEALSAYKSQLDTLMGKYADWYLAEYNRLHITGMQEQEKLRIMRSTEKQVSDAICGNDRGGYITIVPQYQDWNRRMSQLQVANISVTREAILNVPYHGFNPKQFQGKSLPQIADMRNELEQIYENIIKSLHEMAEDPQLAGNATSVLDQSEQRLFKQFHDNHEEKPSAEDAARLMVIIDKLHRDIQKVDITMDDIRRALNHPMTPQEAKKAFGKYIDLMTNGYENENVRVILK